MKKQHLLISLMAVFTVVFLLSRNSLARLAWQKYQRSDIALLLNRNDGKLFMELGNYYFGGGVFDLQKAERAYQKALHEDHKILWGHYQLARIYFIKGDLEFALKEINQELEVNPTNIRSLYVRGLIYGYRGNLTEAEKDFRSFTQWVPKEWAGYNDLAWIIAMQGKYQEVKEVVSHALREVPDADKNPWLWNALGVAQLNKKEYHDAKNSFEKADFFANRLTSAEWQRAYPGNNPRHIETGLDEFRNAIEENLKKATAAIPTP